MVTPPLVPVDRSMALVRVLTEAPVAGDRTVLNAWMVPALLMVLRVSLWSLMASDTRLKGELAGAMVLVGDTVLVSTWAVMLAPLPTLINGRLPLGTDDHAEGAALADAADLGA